MYEFSFSFSLTNQSSEFIFSMASESELVGKVKGRERAWMLYYLLPQFKYGGKARVDSNVLAAGSTRVHRASHERLARESAGMGYGTDEYETWVERTMEEKRVLAAVSAFVVAVLGWMLTRV